jgi:aspartyl-tRNA(Asn)/glutamyl-tRNA(Gln) amidotransferase subunit C
MGRHLSDDTLHAIARLAQLELSDAERATYGPQLDAILNYADLVQGVDTTGVPPTAHVRLSGVHLRDDRETTSLSRDEALANAPDAAVDPGLFRVPRVLGE